MIDFENMTPEKAKDILAPKVEYTEAEHVEAYYKFILEQLHDDFFHLYYIGKEGDTKRVELGDGWTGPEKDAEGKIIKYEVTKEQLLEKLNKILYPENLKEGEHWYSPTHRFNPYWTFEQFKKDATEAMHCGDCTAFPATCQRCYVEEFYGKDTRSWKGKGQGSRLHAIYRPLMLKEIEEEKNNGQD